jgi:hypothetical protein
MTAISKAVSNTDSYVFMMDIAVLVILYSTITTVSPGTVSWHFAARVKKLFSTELLKHGLQCINIILLQDLNLDCDIISFFDEN